MNTPTKRSTIYFDPAIHHALRLKSVHAGKTVSELVNDAVRLALCEDEEDLAAFRERAHEPVMTFEELLKDLKAHGKL
ncbi:MAG TPA: CopG family transcriptional regulator [bacterium]|nr:CopG family transcriptional regulator [bacterium]HPO08862.1 CopG family transcriptional regulator [bacterium]HQQ01200.1 CopG family transcriptional regulator [bacterium]